MSHTTTIAAQVLISLLVNVASCLAGPTEADRARIADEFGNEGRAGATAAGQIVTLARPRVDPSGLAFDPVPPWRSAVFTSEASAPEVVTPIAWEHIEGIDEESSHRTRNGVTGAVIGIAVGSLALCVLTSSIHAGAPPDRAIAATIIASGVAGSVLGAAFTTRDRHPLYPKP